MVQSKAYEEEKGECVGHVGGAERAELREIVKVFEEEEEEDVTTSVVRDEDAGTGEKKEEEEGECETRPGECESTSKENEEVSPEQGERALVKQREEGGEVEDEPQETGGMEVEGKGGDKEADVDVEMHNGDIMNSDCCAEKGEEEEMQERKENAEKEEEHVKEDEKRKEQEEKEQENAPVQGAGERGSEGGVIAQIGECTEGQTQKEQDGEADMGKEAEPPSDTSTEQLEKRPGVSEEEETCGRNAKEHEAKDGEASQDEKAEIRVGDSEKEPTNTILEDVITEYSMISSRETENNRIMAEEELITLDEKMVWEDSCSGRNGGASGYFQRADTNPKASQERGKGTSVQETPSDVLAEKTPKEAIPHHEMKRENGSAAKQSDDVYLFLRQVFHMPEAMANTLVSVFGFGRFEMLEDLQEETVFNLLNWRGGGSEQNNFPIAVGDMLLRSIRLSDNHERSLVNRIWKWRNANAKIGSETSGCCDPCNWSRGEQMPAMYPVPPVRYFPNADRSRREKPRSYPHRDVQCLESGCAYPLVHDAEDSGPGHQEPIKAVSCENDERRKHVRKDEEHTATQSHPVPLKRCKRRHDSSSPEEKGNTKRRLCTTRRLLPRCSPSKESSCSEVLNNEDLEPHIGVYRPHLLGRSTSEEADAVTIASPVKRSVLLRSQNATPGSRNGSTTEATMSPSPLVTSKEKTRKSPRSASRASSSKSEPITITNPKEIVLRDLTGGLKKGAKKKPEVCQGKHKRPTEVTGAVPTKATSPVKIWGRRTIRKQKHVVGESDTATSSEKRTPRSHDATKGGAGGKGGSAVNWATRQIEKRCQGCVIPISRLELSVPRPPHFLQDFDAWEAYWLTGGSCMKGVLDVNYPEHSQRLEKDIVDKLKPLCKIFMKDYPGYSNSVVDNYIRTFYFGEDKSFFDNMCLYCYILLNVLGEEYYLKKRACVNSNVHAKYYKNCLYRQRRESIREYLKALGIESKK